MRKARDPFGDVRPLAPGISTGDMRIFLKDLAIHQGFGADLVRSQNIQQTREAGGGETMSFLIALAALVFLMFVAYRGAPGSCGRSSVIVYQGALLAT